jgi:hypothetical protein
MSVYIYIYIYKLLLLLLPMDIKQVGPNTFIDKVSEKKIPFTPDTNQRMSLFSVVT